MREFTYARDEKTSGPGKQTIKASWTEEPEHNALTKAGAPKAAATKASAKAKAPVSTNSKSKSKRPPSEDDDDDDDDDEDEEEETPSKRPKAA